MATYSVNFDKVPASLKKDGVHYRAATDAEIVFAKELQQYEIDGSSLDQRPPINPSPISADESGSFPPENWDDGEET